MKESGESRSKPRLPMKTVLRRRANLREIS